MHRIGDPPAKAGASVATTVSIYTSSTRVSFQCKRRNAVRIAPARRSNCLGRKSRNAPIPPSALCRANLQMSIVCCKKTKMTQFDQMRARLSSPCSSSRASCKYLLRARSSFPAVSRAILIHRSRRGYLISYTRHISMWRKGDESLESSAGTVHPQTASRSRVRPADRPVRTGRDRAIRPDQVNFVVSENGSVAGIAQKLGHRILTKISMECAGRPGIILHWP
jgi:hypothetical protein